LETSNSQAELAHMYGLIVPTYFSTGTDAGLARRLLLLTLQDTPAYLPWQQVWVVVDGDQRSADTLHTLRRELGPFNLMVDPVNHGKLWVVRQGMQAAFCNPHLNYFITRDCDGDHAASDMPVLVRAANYVQQVCGNTQLVVAGSRRNRVRPLGWIRGELELLLDHVTLEAIRYRLAHQERALNLSWCSGASIPDLNSGYKLYGRDLAQQLFLDQSPILAGISASDYWHYGPETCPMVEALLAGASLAEVPRLTWDGQPTTSFGSFDPTRLYGSMLTWLLTRLDIPLEVGIQWFDNHIVGSALRLTAEGLQLLERLRAYIWQQVSAYRGRPGTMPPPSMRLPFC
jgi:hypothetical protein